MNTQLKNLSAIIINMVAGLILTSGVSAQDVIVPGDNLVTENVPPIPVSYDVQND